MKLGRRITMVSLAVVALGLTSAFTAPASAQTIYTELAHRTSVDPTGGRPILSTPNCADLEPYGAACFKAYGDAWYVVDTRADGADVEVHAMGNWSHGDDAFLCADKATASAGWTTCNDWSSVIPEHYEVAWTLSAVKNGKIVAVAGTVVSSTT